MDNKKINGHEHGREYYQILMGRSSTFHGCRETGHLSKDKREKNTWAKSDFRNSYTGFNGEPKEIRKMVFLMLK